MTSFFLQFVRWTCGCRRWRPAGVLLATWIVLPCANAQVVVEGVITDAAGVPIADADLDFFEAQSGFKVDPSAPGWEAQSDKTDAFGRYEMVVVPEVYHVRFEPPESRTDLAPIFVRDMILGWDTVQDVTLPNGSRLSGLVMDAAGFPVNAVDLDVRDPRGGPKIATVRDDTGADGRFGITVVQGIWDVLFRPPLHSGVGPLRVKGVDLTGDASLSVTLPRGFVVSGRVLREEGPPIFLADLDFDDPDGSRRIPTADDATRVDGQFEVNVSEGTRNVFVIPPPGLPYAPAAIYGVEIDRDLDLGTIVLARGVLLRGTVTDAVDAPQPGVDVDLFVPGTCDRYPGITPPTDAFGEFTLRLEPGSYDVVLTPADGSPLPARRFPAMVVTADGSMDFRLTADLPDAVAASSRVVDESGAGVADLLVRGTPLGAGTSWETTTSAGGAFTFDAVPGRYVIEVTPMGGAGVLPIRLDDVELPCGLASVLTARTAPPIVVPPAVSRALFAFPNPWGPSTTLDLTLPEAVAGAVVTVYDAAGRTVRELHRGALPGGSVRLDWNGRDGRGQSVASGIYLVRVNTPAQQFTAKLVRIRP